jgi:hypothetical protein
VHYLPQKSSLHDADTESQQQQVQIKGRLKLCSRGLVSSSISVYQCIKISVTIGICKSTAAMQATGGCACL